MVLGKRFYGEIGETFAAELLENKGYKIISKNFHSRFGEIDLIAKDKDTLVFVEVKTRWSRKFGSAREAVTQSKLAKIKKTIDYYLFVKGIKNPKLRIEVVAIEVDEGKIINANLIKVD